MDSQPHSISPPASCNAGIAVKRRAPTPRPMPPHSAPDVHVWRQVWTLPRQGSSLDLGVPLGQARTRASPPSRCAGADSTLAARDTGSRGLVPRWDGLAARRRRAPRFVATRDALSQLPRRPSRHADLGCAGWRRLGHARSNSSRPTRPGQLVPSRAVRLAYWCRHSSPLTATCRGASAMGVFGSVVGLTAPRGDDRLSAGQIAAKNHPV